ncbi:hypothetical protein [Bradyrhizobium sp.]|uniref:hypothetical protein n=1 Tax=Bradyrhizobium sp. TaxID=376 RepID=UPI00271609E5|nr:hypothetical protein [Bradyrhizobium sp.]MDO9299051.1 hypothetical protein [Bradyrhizobium sp.]
MERDLESEQIGLIGEQQFQLLCAQAGLVCNKSTVDVMGWDFIVEFPADHFGSAISLDQRQAKAVRVQLKSTLRRTHSRVRLSLSSVDRLAKDPHPSVIVAFRMNHEGKLQSGYLVHLIGDELARVLKRLRLAEANEAHDINKTNISYDYEKLGTRFEPTSEGLLEALKFICKEDSAAYTIEKQRQLAELGYELGRFEAEAIALIEGPQHLNNVLLGLTPLKPVQFRVFDSRFGIRLPYQGALFDDLDDLVLTPPTLGPCVISIKAMGFGQAARFDAEMFVGPPIGAVDGPELLIRHPDFLIRLRRSEAKFETLHRLDDVRRSLEQHAELARALSSMAGGRAELTISGTARFPAVSLPFGDLLSGPYVDQLPAISKFLDGWQMLLLKAGVGAGDGFNFDEIWTADEAQIAVEMLLSPKPVARLEFQSLADGNQAQSLEALLFRTCSLGGTSLTYSVRIIFEHTDDPVWRYRSARFEALDVRPKVVDLQEYGYDQGEAHGIALLLDPRSLTLDREARIR